MSEASGFARAERAILIVALLLLTVAVAYGEFARQRSEREARARDTALAEDISAVRDEAKAAFTSLIPQETVTRTNASVYAIVVDNRLFGTAFVVDRENGVLATAAHVADALPFDNENARIGILNRFNGASIPVLTVRNHSGFGAFRSLVEEFQPIRPQTPILRPQVLPLRDLAFDAALLTVEPLDPQTGENRLGPDLPLAAEDALLELSAGAPIAVIGFPYDTLDDGFAASTAISRVDRGVISAMIAPLDNAATKGDPVIANLIIHRLSTAGGNSGSPVINAAGEVVGIHTHGIESLSGNADGAAQRADVLHDLLNEGRDQRRLMETFVPAWTRTLSFWRSAKDVLPWSFYLERTDAKSMQEKLIADFDLAAPTPFTTVTQELEFGEALDGFTLSADDLSGIGANPADAGEGLEAGQNGDRAVFQIDEKGEFASAEFTIDRSKDNLIYAFDYSLRRQLGFCQLKAYWRKIGDRRMAIQAPRASTEIFLPAVVDGGVETYQFLFQRRAACDPASSSFYASVLSWNSGEGPGVSENIVAAFFPQSDHVQLATPEPGSVAKVLNSVRFRCMITRKIDNTACDSPSFIEAKLLVADDWGSAEQEPNR